MAKLKTKDALIMFIAADHWHRVSNIEWRTSVAVHHGEDNDKYTIDYELEWAKAVVHYADPTITRNPIDLSKMSVVNVFMPVKDPLYGLKIAVVDDYVPPTKRDIELAELMK